MDTTKPNIINHLSLCTGYEGIGQGLRKVLPNVREIAYVEIEAFAIANLVNKIETGRLHQAPIYTNLKTFPYRKFRGLVDIISGGFPCQPFSQAGVRKATEDPRHLFPFIAEGIRECQPRIVFLENVEGILSCKTTDGEPVLQYVLRTLEEMGYRATAGIFSASEVGAPHQRKRVFILGYSESGGSSEECTDGRERILSNEREWDKVRSETERCCDTSREELGNTFNNGQPTSKKSRKISRSQEERGLQEFKGGSNKLGDSECERLEGSIGQSDEGSMQGLAISGRKLSDTDIERLEGSVPKGEPKEQTEESSSRCSWGKYPARPNEEQHEWEAPRVVEAEPKLGRAADGTSSRVDRLRLLGNGVVPQTAAKAFVTLINRII